MLGKSPRQIMRDVASGKLPAAGGGRGVPYSFDVAALRAVAGNAAGIELLARARHGWSSGAMSSAVLFYFQQPEDSPLGSIMLQEGLPPLSAVSVEVRTWAHRTGGRLTLKETRFLAAVFVASYSPVVNPNPKKRDVFRDTLAALGLVEGKRDVETMVYFITALCQGDREGVRRATAYTQRGKGDSLPIPIHPTASDPARFPELNVVQTALLDYTRAAARRDRLQGKEKPSGPAVAELLGVSRQHVGRLWQGVRRKLGRDGVAELLRVFGWETARQIPRYMKPTRRAGRVKPPPPQTVSLPLAPRA